MREVINAIFVTTQVLQRWAIALQNLNELFEKIIVPPFHREVRHLQVVGIVVYNRGMMRCGQEATTPSCGAGRLV